MNADLDLDRTAILQALSLDEIENVLSKFGHTHGMMFIQEALIHFFLWLLETSTRHISFAHGFYLLETILFTELIEGIVNVVEPFAKLSSSEHLHNRIEIGYIAKNDRHLALIIGYEPLALANALSYKGRHENVQDRFELGELLDLLVSLPVLNAHRLFFPIDKQRPAYHIYGPHSCDIRKNKGPSFFVLWLSFVLAIPLEMRVHDIDVHHQETHSNCNYQTHICTVKWKHIE